VCRPAVPAASSARIYWENSVHKTKAGEVSIPAAVSRFPREIIPLPRSWAERAYPNLVYFNELEKGGHFAARLARSHSPVADMPL
jgi:hypothetical protein